MTVVFPGMKSELSPLRLWDYILQNGLCSFLFTTKKRSVVVQRQLYVMLFKCIPSIKVIKQ